MTGIDPALSNLAESLTAVVETDDVSRLRDHLRGRTLPAMGGNEDPADILLRALSPAQRAPDFMRRLARLLGALISEEVAALTVEGFSPRRLSLLRSGLYLASALPAETKLFSSLKDLLGALETHEPGRDASTLSLPLWQALVYQQTDASLEETWLSLLSTERQEPSTPAQRTLLLIAWRGLLWAPPSPEALQAEEVVDFKRIQNGLQGLYRSLLLQQGDDFGPSDVSSFMELCLDVLQETYPRSGEFWVRNLRSHSAGWPPALTATVLSRWPLLAQMDNPSPQKFSQVDRETSDRALDELGKIYSQLEALKAAADEVVAYYEAQHIEEALNSVAAMLTQLGPMFGVAATRLSQDIAWISRQVDLLRSWQDMEKIALSNLSQNKEIRQQEMTKRFKAFIRWARRQARR